MNEAIIREAASRAIVDNNFFMADPNNPHFVDRGLEQMNACKWVISYIFSLPLAQRLTDAEKEKVREKYDWAKINLSQLKEGGFNELDPDVVLCSGIIRTLNYIFGEEFFNEDKL